MAIHNGHDLPRQYWRAGRRSGRRGAPADFPSFRIRISTEWRRVTSRGAKDQSTTARRVATRTPNAGAGPWCWSTPKCPAVHGLVASSSRDRPPRSGHSRTKSSPVAPRRYGLGGGLCPPAHSVCRFTAEGSRRKALRRPARIASSRYFRGNGAPSRRRQHKRITALRRTRGK